MKIYRNLLPRPADQNSGSKPPRAARRISPAGAGVMAAVFLAVLFISLLCTMLYNTWLDGIRRLEQAEGGWHLRVAGQLGEEELALVRGFAHVARAELTRTEAAGGGAAPAQFAGALPGGMPGEGTAAAEDAALLEIVFSPVSAAPREGPLIAAALGLDHGEALDRGVLQYHEELLALCLVRAPGDTAPRLLLPFYLAVTGIVCLSLVLIIHNAFAVAMNDTVRELGVLSSIGATPGQLLRRLLGQALLLTALPGLAGLAAGVGLAAACFGAILHFARQFGISGGPSASFAYHPALLAATLLAAFGTVLISALLPAWRLSRLSPLEALRTAGEPAARRRPGPLARLLSPRSPEGMLAAGALRAQRKALRSGSLALTLAFLSFLLIQGFFTLSGISTRYTYFFRYQDAWDVMAEVQDASIGAFTLTAQLNTLPGVRDAVVYQRGEGSVLLPETAQSEPLRVLGGIGALTGAAAEDGVFAVPAELVVLDDAAFAAYCAAQGLPQLLDGAAVYDRVWDSLHSNFRYPVYLPFLQSDLRQLTLAGAAGDAADKTGQTETLLPLLGLAGAPPLLREEYDGHSLAIFLPVSLWRQLDGSGAAPRQAGPLCIRLLAEEGASPAELDALQQALAQLLAGGGYAAGCENRVAEKQTNDRILSGFRLVLGLCCGYLALIGLAGTFAHTMSFVRLRRREIARYESVGMTPAQLRRMFLLEALILAGRPAAFSLALGSLALGGMIRASYLDPAEFWAEAPVLPVLGFVLAAFALVGLAYWLGARRLLKASLAETLRDETLG